MSCSAMLRHVGFDDLDELVFDGGVDEEEQEEWKRVAVGTKKRREKVEAMEELEEEETEERREKEASREENIRADLSTGKRGSSPDDTIKRCDK